MSRKIFIILLSVNSMPFWIFKKKEEPKGPEVILPTEDSRVRLEEDVQFLVDYFHEIARELSKIEHNATSSEAEIAKIKKIESDFRKLVEKLRKREPEFIGYWNGLLNITEDFVIEIRRVLPNSTFEIPLDQKRVEEVGRISRRNSSAFVGMLEDVKKKLNKTYRRTFKIGWPERVGFP